MNKIILPDFIIVPYQLLEDKEITLIDERLYGIVYWFAKLKLEKCTASNATLAELVKTTPTTIQNSLTKLESKNYVKRIFKDIAKRHRLEIVPLVVFSKVSPTDDTKNLVSLTSDRVSPTDDSVVSPTDDQKKKLIKKNNKEEVSGTHFEKFWSCYPSKEGKKKCLSIWNSKKLDIHSDDIISFVEMAKLTDRWIAGYIKNPTTFLNQECWNDDLSSYANRKGKTQTLIDFTKPQNA